MAVILLSLTIIGVVAAITLPSLTGNINEKTWNTQRKALYARISQAVALMPYLNGYGIGATDSETRTKAAKMFVNDGLRRVLKINNICAYNSFDKCGIASTIKTPSGATKTFPKKMNDLNSEILAGSYSDSLAHDNYSIFNTYATAFETANGESIAVFYNPTCKPNDGMPVQLQGRRFNFIPPYMCANFIFDLNGKKGPNTFGKDIGAITVFYSTDSHVVMPIPLPKDSASGQSYADAQNVCRNISADVRMPNKEELGSTFFNAALWGITVVSASNSSGRYAASRQQSQWIVNMHSGSFSTDMGFGSTLRVRCVKR